MAKKNINTKKLLTQAGEHWKSGKKKESLEALIASETPLTNRERSMLTIASECETGKKENYTRLGLDILTINKEADKIIDTKCPN